MKVSDFKYYIGIILIIVLDSLHSVFYDNWNKYDVYLFFNHKRYLTNILYDISNLFKFSLLTYFLTSYNRRVFKPLFILSIFIWFFYFINYNQLGYLLLVPIYLVLILFFKWKNQ